MRGGCKYSITARNVNKNNRTLPAKWTYVITNNTYNHPPLDNIDMAILRQASVTPKVQTFLNNEVDNCVKAWQLLVTVKNAFPNALLTAGDLYRLTFRRKAALHDGHTASEALINKL